MKINHISKVATALLSILAAQAMATNATLVVPTSVPAQLVIPATPARFAPPATPATLVLPARVQLNAEPPLLFTAHSNNYNYNVDLNNLPPQGDGGNFQTVGNVTIENTTGTDATVCFRTTISEFTTGIGPRITIPGRQSPAIYYSVGIDCTYGGPNSFLTDPRGENMTYINQIQTLIPNGTTNCTIGLGFDHDNLTPTDYPDRLTKFPAGTYSSDYFDITIFQGSEMNCGTTVPDETAENTIHPTFSFTIPNTTTLLVADPDIHFNNIFSANWWQSRTAFSTVTLVSNDLAGVSMSFMPNTGDTNSYQLLSPPKNAITITASIQPCGNATNMPIIALNPTHSVNIPPQYLNMNCVTDPGYLRLTTPALQLNGTPGVNQLPPPGSYSNTFTLDVSNN